VRVPNTQGLHRTTQFLMQQYLNLVDWKGLELLSTERRCKASVKKFKCSPTVLAECIELQETLSKFQSERGNETLYMLKNIHEIFSSQFPLLRYNVSRLKPVTSKCDVEPSFSKVHDAGETLCLVIQCDFLF